MEDFSGVHEYIERLHVMTKVQQNGGGSGGGARAGCACQTLWPMS